MAKMSQYTPLDENDKEYFFGEGEGAVVTVGETSASSGKVNRLVKLSDIGGGAGGVPNAGKGIEYDESTNTLSFYYNGSGGFTTENDLHNHEMMKVKAGVGIEVDNKGVSIDTQHANEGDVLTYHKNGSTDEVVWTAPGGGGGGNPYTKVNVTPGDCYLNGKTSSSDMPLYDQDVTISNNTYSILTSPIGYYPVVEEPEYRNAHNLDNLVIKLPNNTEFPMAVVEFTVQDSDDYYQQGCVNNVKVKIGETELTRMYSAPYNPNTLLLGGAHHDQFEYWKLVTEPNQGNPYYRIEEIHNAYRGADITAFTHGTKVQVQIFGSCFNVIISQACGEPSAS